MAWAVENGYHEDDRSWRVRGQDRQRGPRPRRCGCPLRRSAVVSFVVAVVAVAASRSPNSLFAPTYAGLVLVSDSSGSVVSPRSPSRGRRPVLVREAVVAPRYTRISARPPRHLTIEVPLITTTTRTTTTTTIQLAQ